MKLRTAWEKPAPRFSCLRLMLSVAERADSAGELEGLGPSRRLQEPGWPGVLGKSKRSRRLCAPLTWPRESHRGKSWVPKSWLPPSAAVGALAWELFQRGRAVSLHVPWRAWGWTRDSESPRPPTPRRFQKHALPCPKSLRRTQAASSVSPGSESQGGERLDQPAHSVRTRRACSGPRPFHRPLRGLREGTLRWPGRVTRSSNPLVGGWEGEEEGC